jgi:glycosyltransferase involved in cell wall biosynthesis
MHIGFVVNAYPHPHGGGGAGTYVQLVGRELAKRGIRVSVVTDHCGECPEEYYDDEVFVHRPKLKKRNLHWYFSKIPLIGLGSIILRYLENGWAVHQYLLKLNKEQPIDIVEFAEGGDFWSVFQSPYSYVAHLHGSRYTSMKMSGRLVNYFDWIERRLELFFVKRAGWVFSPSRAMLEMVQKEAKYVFASSSVIKLPVDPGLSFVKIGNGKDDGITKILFAGGSQYIKGGDILLAAAERILKEYKKVFFVFIGCNPDDIDCQLVEGIIKKPFLPKEEILKEIAQSDICVVPSRWENSPNIIYEAMAAGKVVIASRAGGIPELVIDGETGLLFKNENPEELAKAIALLLSNKDLGKKMGENGRIHVQKIAGIEKNVGKRLRIYEHILEERVPPC